MASCLTSSSSSSNPSSCNLLSQLLLKKQFIEEKFERHDTFFSESSTFENYYVFGDFKRSVEKDTELARSLIQQFEACNKETFDARTLLQENAEEKRTDEAEGDNTAIVHVQFSVPEELMHFFEMIRELELCSFVFKLCLRRIDLTRDEDKEKHVNLQDLEHAIHNAQQAIEEYKYPIDKKCYNKEEQKKRLENALRKVLEEKEKTSFEMAEEDLIRFKRDTSQLCALLGLKLDFLDCLEEMPPEHRHHRKLSEWIKIFLEDNSLSVVTEDKDSLTKELLASIGFDPLSTAIETIMARSFKGNMQQHIEACEWAQMFIEDEFKYNSLLSPLTAKFPFQSYLTNTWFQLPNRTDTESGRNDDLSDINIMNLVTKESNACRNTQSQLSGFVPQDEQNIVFYHGTDHKSAEQILVRGIYLRAGRQKRDFSCGKGFYLTNKMDDALNWAISTTAKTAILVFVVDREYLDKARKLNLNENERKWQEIVSSFRTAKRTAKTRKSLSSYDLIEGPVAKVTRNQTSEELVFEPKPSSYQMCLISDDFAEEFEKTLHSVVFIDMS